LEFPTSTFPLSASSLSQFQETCNGFFLIGGESGNSMQQRLAAADCAFQPQEICSEQRGLFPMGIQFLASVIPVVLVKEPF